MISRLGSTELRLIIAIYCIKFDKKIDLNVGEKIIREGW